MRATLQTETKTSSSTRPTFTPVRGGLLQRKCACGGTPGPSGECEACRKKRLQRKGNGAGAETQNTSAVPPIVHEVLRSPGRTLDAETRAFMEPRFGYDFSNVRVHADAHAAESASAIDALAYTVGNHIAFAAGKYRAASPEGTRLIAHELAHVVQGNGAEARSLEMREADTPEERSAETTAETVSRGGKLSSRLPRVAYSGVARSVGSRTNCPANSNGALADPLTDLQDDDGRALEIATNAATTLAAAPTDAQTLQTFTTRFGAPPAQGAGFLNRLTGAVRPSQEVATNEELGILRRRYQIVARFFSQPIAFRCIGGAASFGTCSPPHCNSVFAWSCRGTGAIFLCPDYWTDTNSSVDERAAVLVHEAFHINFGQSAPSQQGQVGDAVVHGSGRNFVIADCYSGFAADLAGVTNPADSCPAP